MKTHAQLSVAILFSALLFSAPSQAADGNVTVDIVAEHMPARARAYSEVLIALLALGIALIVVWQNWLEAARLNSLGQVTDYLHLPSYPFRLLISFGFLVLAAEFGRELVHALGKLLGRRT